MLCNSIPVNQRLMVQEITLRHGPQIVFKTEKGIVMGKDREGNYHPPKGKPSDEGNKKGITSPPVSKKKAQRQEDLEDKYDVDADNESAENIKMMHPNRNENKELDRQSPKEQHDFKNKNLSSREREDTIDIVQLNLSELDELLGVSASTNSEC